MQLSFVVQQKKKRNIKFNFKALLTVFLIIVAVALNVVLGLWLGVNNVQTIEHFVKPSFYVAPMVNMLISLPVLIVAGISSYFSIMFEPNKKQVILYLCSSLVLNLLLLVSVFVLNSLLISLLLIVSNVVVCAYYFKTLKSKSLGQLLFIPYIIWLLFNTVCVYALYLLN